MPLDLRLLRICHLIAFAWRIVRIRFHWHILDKFVWVRFCTSILLSSFCSKWNAIHRAHLIWWFILKRIGSLSIKLHCLHRILIAFHGKLLLLNSLGRIKLFVIWLLTSHLRVYNFLARIELLLRLSYLLLAEILHLILIKRPLISSINTWIL